MAKTQNTYPKTITDSGALMGLRLAAEYETGISLYVGGEIAVQLDATNFRLTAVRYFTKEKLDFEMEYISDTCPNTGEKADVYDVVCVQERDHYNRKNQEAS